MKKFNTVIVTSALLTALIAVFLVDVHQVSSQGKQNAPGQAKKEEQTSDDSNNSPKDDKTNPGQEKKNEVIVGSVDDIEGNTIQVEETEGKKHEVIVDQKAKVIGKDNKPVKLGAIKVKDIIAIVGEEGEMATEAGKFKVKKVFVQEASASAQMKRRAVQGVLTDITGSVLTVVHQIHRDRIYTVFYDDSTVIKSKEASGSATPQSFSVGQRIVAVGDLDASGSILAKRIHIIPGLATGIFKKQPLATPSPTLTVTITATPTEEATPSATPASEVAP
ncbi:hypothetical protein HY469_04630 [Candidatus Roizmanbacteria bacterium]|nr:hypothetical protein [Candidatus Roizmanbacteria bacterium]